MRRSALIVLVLLAIVGSAIAGPQFKVLQDYHNFGQVAEGPFITHSFWVKSVGDQPLVITNIDPGCSCTQVPLRDSVLNPGESTAVEIILRTRRLTGNVEKRPEFTTNASEKPFILKLYAQVIEDPEAMQPLVLRPAKIDVSQFGEKPRRKAKFWIFNPTDQPLDVYIVDSLDKSFTVDFPKVIPAKDSVQAGVTVRKDKITTDFGESFTFEVKADGYPRYTVPIARVYKTNAAPPAPAGTKK